MRLTTLELKVIRGIATNYFHDGKPPIGNPVWSDCLDSTDERGMPAGKHLAGTISSLCKKGLVKSDGECVWLLEPARPYLPKELR